jgi:hypothetical protein
MNRIRDTYGLQLFILYLRDVIFLNAVRLDHIASHWQASMTLSLTPSSRHLRAAVLRIAAIG